VTLRHWTALAVLAALALGAVPLWGDLRPRPPLRLRSRAGIVLVVFSGALAVAAAVAVNERPAVGAARSVVAALSVAAALVGGGPIALSVLRLADHGRHTAGPGPSDPNVLHAGAWMGSMERLAVSASLLAGWPEGIAVVLAVKGLGRYPELRVAAAAERFIIGTFASVLWAAACAGVGIALLR
jgi:hypothetical protein